MNEKKYYRKEYKKYLYYRFLIALKDYDKKYRLEPNKTINIDIDMNFIFPQETVKFLKEEITRKYPERR